MSELAVGDLVKVILSRSWIHDVHKNDLAIVNATQSSVLDEVQAVQVIHGKKTWWLRRWEVEKVSV